MRKERKTFSFYGSTELDNALREFQLRNNIESKSKAINVLLNTGLRNWSPPLEAKERNQLPDGENNPSQLKSQIHKFYALITGEGE
ncbi:MAG: hypothetical protein AMS17_05080 [Spirochaetes bacterium DG_61]|jgi:hypothetical protein|nr:MAG: hypothetical protein AMS17_05080 [Spirochaetes bacterium DG_61]